ncbi:MAG TPA: hydrolase 2, exosortase A system-associated [Methylophilaceae bacterium]|jgi:exosortase A-associated hydrolase 2|nr:hydrolase 2, exosortase A system-associated [Methylophilaceae bacterium]
MTMRQADFQIEPFFLTGRHGALFCLYLAPHGRAPKAAILYLHPFAEEMHKSRRMAALQARLLAANGYAVLQVDLTGCGDSACDFGDARWDTWRDDARRAHAWLTERAPGPVLLWGLRSGGALAVVMATELPAIARLLLWQPLINGEQFLQQFLRIKLANEMLSAGQSSSGSAGLIARLQSGAAIEVGGYLLAPEMAAALQTLKLDQLAPSCPVEWFEISTQGGGALSPASQGVVDTWRSAGVTVREHVLPGEPFWTTQEIMECPELVTATLKSLEA